MTLVDEQSIIETYSPEEQFSCKKYFEYQKLLQENPKIGYKKCAKLLGVSQGRTRWWHTKGPKKAIPLPLKTAEKLKTAGLITFSEGHKYAEIIFNILGTIFGDGGIDRNLNTMAFISGDKRDIDLWENDLLKIFPFAIGKTNLIEGGEYGHSYNIRTFDRAVIRFFVALGAPVGSKVATNYSLPKYIFDLSETNRIAFLDGLLASEVSVPSFRDDSKGHKRFTNLMFSLAKIDSLENQHKNFMRSMEQLLGSVGIATTGHLRKDIHLERKRKDGNLSSPYRIFLRTIFQRILDFNELFQLRYAADKKERLQKEIEKALAYKKQNPNSRIRWYLRPNNILSNNAPEQN